jgi:hypothetical protein
MGPEKSVTRNSTHEEFYKDPVRAKGRHDALLAGGEAEGVTLFLARNYDWMGKDDVYYGVRYVSLREITA